jgi:bacteriocin-like protein
MKNQQSNEAATETVNSAFEQLSMSELNLVTGGDPAPYPPGTIGAYVSDKTGAARGTRLHAVGTFLYKWGLL